MNLKTMKEAGPQLGAAVPAADTLQAWAKEIAIALGAKAGFGTVACGSCDRDVVPDIVFCPYCGHSFVAAEALPEPEPELPKRRILIKQAINAGLSAGDFLGKTDKELHQMLAGLTSQS